MSWNSKVVWSEGMFLRPQHFQQQDRYVESLVRGRCGHLRPYDWGLSKLMLDQDALAMGKVAIASCRGILPDGTPFRIPDGDAPPVPLVVEAEVRDARVLLALPIRREGMPEVDRADVLEGVARHHAIECEVRDSNVGAEGSVPIEVAQRRLRLLLDRGEHREYACIGVARVVELRPDQQVVLDDKYVPPCLECQGSPQLAGFMSEILGLLHQRGEALAGRVSASGRGGASEIADFLLLQLVNRFEPLFAHLSEMHALHPEDFYRVALQLAGELSTFTGKTKRPASFPVYRQDDLQATFAPVMLDLRQALSMVLEQNAIQLPLQERQYGIRVSPITDRNLLVRASFVLAVNADIPGDTLRSRFPTQVKIGPVEHIRQLVNSQLPGIGLRALPVAPRQIPYHAGVVYFELDRNNEHWKQLTNSGGFAFHIGAQFPGIELAFWAIKG